MLHGDLVWWRSGQGWRTLVTIHGDIEGVNGAPEGSLPEVPLALTLHAPDGTPLARHTLVARRGEHVYLDSRCPPGALARVPAGDGVLSISATLPPGFHGFRRLFSMVDWISEAGELVTLHSDQAMMPEDRLFDLTEIVAGPGTALVVANGACRQPARALALSITNHARRTQEARYRPAMAPFSLHRIELGALFPDLESFAGGRPVAVRGAGRLRRLFLRPYVITPRGGYHGGNRLDSVDPVPAFVHRALGRGETNPMLVVQSDEVRTAVHLFNSHGRVRGRFGVDARLYDAEGRLVAERARWLSIARHGLASAEVGDLLPAGTASFTGHLSLSYSADARKSAYPWHVQALVEYRTARGFSCVATWSDFWNADAALVALRDRLGPLAGVLAPPGGAALPDRPVRWKSFYRVVWQPPVTTALAITYGRSTEGPAPDAAYEVTLEGPGGTRRARGSIAPFATQRLELDALFPDIAEVLGGGGQGLVTVESERDLALMQLTRDARSGALAAEHLMSVATYVDGVPHMPRGS